MVDDAEGEAAGAGVGEVGGLTVVVPPSRARGARSSACLARVVSRASRALAMFLVTHVWPINSSGGRQLGASGFIMLPPKYRNSACATAVNPLWQQNSSIIASVSSEGLALCRRFFVSARLSATAV